MLIKASYSVGSERCEERFSARCAGNIIVLHPTTILQANFSLAVSWCLTCVVFIFCYTGVLTSILAAPSYMPSIKNLEELAYSKVLKPVTIISTAVDDIMLVINTTVDIKFFITSFSKQFYNAECRKRDLQGSWRFIQKVP